MALHIDLKIGDAVSIGEATVTLEDKSGKLARLRIDADKDVKISRLPVTHRMAHLGLNYKKESAA